MQMTHNTMLITGGGSGIGRALAEAFYHLGNTVILAGRRQDILEQITAAHPGMHFLVLDVQDEMQLPPFVQQITTRFPALNVLINNAGIMRREDLLTAATSTDAEATIRTNLLAPIRLTSALLPQLLRQPQSTIVNVTSGLAFVPLAETPTYCATKAALHSYTQSLRYQLKDTAVRVVELIPPYVATELSGKAQATDPRAMPLEEYITEVLELFRTQPDATEICVQRVYPLRYAAAQGQPKYEEIFQGLNGSFAHE